MSGQMPDIIVLNDEEFVIVEPGPGMLVDVRAHGVAPVMMHSANTRGVLARFRITDDERLVLSDLQVGSVDAPPPINGVEATTDEYGQTWTYLALDMTVEWSGDLIVGADPILDLYVHAGFPPVWHYERVQAFAIEAGMVRSSEDRSEQVAAFRAERTGGAGSDGNSANAGDAAVEEDEGMFERFLDSIKLKLGMDDEPESV